ncbi:response regulator transcription factor [Atopobium fossor]|uniref:response regulator transcription factor n=1 Tax=Atopobium fossor TaxID=39487 RepID=UPI0003F50B3D|nr:response regulator transcription factor [Atopobium fossor]
MQARILLADDDAHIREVVSVLLTSEGYDVQTAADGNEALQLFKNVQTNACYDEAHNQPYAFFDLIILDVLMPGLSGLEVCKYIREQSNTPVLFLTARSQDADKVRGFTVGGDDYLPKPFSAVEMLARVKALLRRYHRYGGSPIQENRTKLMVGDITIDVSGRRIFGPAGAIALTDFEFSVLLLLAQNKDKIFSAREIYEAVWNEPFLEQSANNVMVHIRNLRRKLGDNPQNPRYIRTVWGRGYTIG